MVRLCLAGGGLSPETVQDLLAEAARLYAEGDGRAATDIYREILRHSPQESQALHMLGVAARQAGNPALAMQFTEAALRFNPELAQAWFNRGVILRETGRNRESLQSVRIALQIAPDLAAAWDLLGLILKDLGDYTEAVQCHAHAIGLQPENASFHANRAPLLMALDDSAGAYRALRRAEALDPEWPPLPLGNMLQSMGYPEQAASCFARARALRPGYAESAASEAMARLQMGEMEQGWKLWEQRPDLAQNLSALPFWQGEKIGRLLLYEDQGLGDAIQFARYIPMLKGRADSIVLQIRAPLKRLFAENFPGIDIIVEGDAVPAADARYRLSSLPFLFATRLDTIPARPYLSAPQESRLEWRERLKTRSAPRIGLVWGGNARFNNDYARSIAFPALQVLLAQGAAHFVSLQKDRPGEQAALTEAGIADMSHFLNDFADTAALMAELDLIVTVDTAIAHLAGALGKPVFILLPFGSDWRWLLGREDSPWYPSARLFRQKKPGDWQGVIEKVAAEVEKLIAGDRGVLQAPKWGGESLRRNPDALPLPA